MEKYELFYIVPERDWRERALEDLEPDIKRFSSGWYIKGLEKEDIEQELRFHLWRKLPKFNPFKAALRTWAWQVMRNRRIDLDRRANDLLDSEFRVFPEGDASDIQNNGMVGQELE